MTPPPHQQPPGVIPPNTPSEVVPALVETMGMHSGAEPAAAAAAVPAPAVAAFAAPVVAVLDAPPDNCAAVAKLVLHPVDGNSNAPGSEAIVKVVTLSGSQLLAIASGTEEPATPLLARFDADGVTVDAAKGVLGNARLPATPF